MSSVFSLTGRERAVVAHCANDTYVIYTPLRLRDKLTPSSAALPGGVFDREPGQIAAARSPPPPPQGYLGTTIKSQRHGTQRFGSKDGASMKSSNFRAQDRTVVWKLAHSPEACGDLDKSKRKTAYFLISFWTSTASRKTGFQTAEAGSFLEPSFERPDWES